MRLVLERDRATTEQRRGIYPQVKPGLQWLSMGARAVWEDRYSPLPQATSSEYIHSDPLEEESHEMA
jgi:hypothetical protein